MLKKIFYIFLTFLFLIPFNAYSASNSASSAIVIDALTGTVLYEKNAYEQRAVASTTKIMTALLAIESGRLDDTVKITEEMVNVEGSSLGLKAGDKLTLYDLVLGMMLTSGNDSANAVACFLAENSVKFAQMMNERALELGMKNTEFVTPSGLDEGNHHSTAYDMALLSVAAIKSDIFCEIVSKQSATLQISGNSVTVYNHNKLLAMDESIFGIKTGYTEKAGRCLVSAKNYNKNQLVCVTLNCPDDWNDHLALYKECVNKYNEQVIENNVSVAVVGGKSETVKCSYNATYYTLEDLQITEYYHPFLYAPINKGETIGTAVIIYSNKIIERLPIEADEEIEIYGEQ